ncbi:hypothetical protein C8R44DRAFT_736604 [Mycena epipterygia]|nr:hypothetical protein C8R44DRAFT_736604 [Mycena epipterygia]
MIPLDPAKTRILPLGPIKISMSLVHDTFFFPSYDAPCSFEAVFGSRDLYRRARACPQMACSQMAYCRLERYMTFLSPSRLWLTTPKAHLVATHDTKLAALAAHLPRVFTQDHKVAADCCPGLRRCSRLHCPSPPTPEVDGQRHVATPTEPASRVLLMLTGARSPLPLASPPSMSFSCYSRAKLTAPQPGLTPRTTNGDEWPPLQGQVKKSIHVPSMEGNFFRSSSPGRLTRCAWIADRDSGSVEAYLTPRSNCSVRYCSMPATWPVDAILQLTRGGGRAATSVGNLAGDEVWLWSASTRRTLYSNEMTPQITVVLNTRLSVSPFLEDSRPESGFIDIIPHTQPVQQLHLASISARSLLNDLESAILPRSRAVVSHAILSRVCSSRILGLLKAAICHVWQRPLEFAPARHPARRLLMGLNSYLLLVYASRPSSVFFVNSRGQFKLAFLPLFDSGRRHASVLGKASILVPSCRSENPSDISYAQLPPHCQLMAAASPHRAFKLLEDWAVLKPPLHADWVGSRNVAWMAHLLPASDSEPLRRRTFHRFTPGTTKPSGYLNAAGCPGRWMHNPRATERPDTVQHPGLVTLSRFTSSPHCGRREIADYVVADASVLDAKRITGFAIAKYRHLKTEMDDWPLRARLRPGGPPRAATFITRNERTHYSSCGPFYRSWATAHSPQLMDIPDVWSIPTKHDNTAPAFPSRSIV